MDLSALSKRYSIRRMDDSDADSILELCKGNTQYYLYCQAEPSREQILNDLPHTFLPYVHLCFLPYFTAGAMETPAA